MDAEQFSLKWNNFHSNLSSGFHALLRGEDLVDVTFAVDGKFLQAHKLVLSVCSPYFKQMFKIQPEKHPIIILKGVTYKELSDILSFMYRGEVNVRQEDLSNFLKTAELLQVKGLTDNDNDTAESNNTMQEEIKVAHAQQTPMHLKHEETMKQPVYKMDYALDPLAQNTPVSTSLAPKRSAHRLNPVSHNKKTRKEEPPMVEEVRVEELLNVNHTQTPKTEPVCIEDEDFDSSSNMADGLHMLDPKDMMAPCLLPMGSSLVPDGTLTDQEQAAQAFVSRYSQNYTFAPGSSSSKIMISLRPTESLVEPHRATLQQLRNAHAISPGLQCLHCGNHYKNANSLRVHTYITHRKKNIKAVDKPISY